jgi:hypothetical protein
MQRAILDRFDDRDARCAILDRFDDRDARHVYEDLLCLMNHRRPDPDGELPLPSKVNNVMQQIRII